MCNQHVFVLNFCPIKKIYCIFLYHFCMHLPPGETMLSNVSTVIKMIYPFPDFSECNRCYHKEKFYGLTGTKDIRKKSGNRVCNFLTRFNPLRFDKIHNIYSVIFYFLYRQRIIEGHDKHNFVQKITENRMSLVRIRHNWVSAFQILAVGWKCVGETNQLGNL